MQRELIISKVIEPLGSIADKNIAIEIKRFFKKQKSVGVERTVSQVSEIIQSKSVWKSRDSKKIGEWLKHQRF